MAFKLQDVGGYGTGALGDITNPTGQINSYANVTALGNGTITIGTPANGVYEKFEVGKEIQIHVSARSSGTDAQYLGKNAVATITAVNGSVLSLSKDISGLPPSALPGLVPSADFANHYVQAFTIAQFDSLSLTTGNITPPVYNVTSKYGGIIALKCKTELVLNGGSINLVDKGIPIASKALRPLTAQENELSTLHKSFGWENHITQRQLLLNAGDGVAWLLAKKISVFSATSRIGGTTAGVANFPYNNIFSKIATIVPSNIAGGSTILIASDAISGFVPDIISKGKSTGQGYGRCYIATETALPADERLYAQDCLSNPLRLRNLGIKDFGNGTLGNVVNPTGCINSYANVTAIDGQKIVIENIVNGIYGTFSAGMAVMFHVTTKKTTSDSALFGKFFNTKIIATAIGEITLESPIPFMVPLENYYCQLITIPQFENFTISNTYDKTLIWDSTKKLGGIAVLKAKGTVDISNGKIALAGKGLPYSRPILSTQCSGQQKDYLPISQTGGAVLIIADTLTGNNDSLIGGNASGVGFSGIGSDQTYPIGDASPGIGGIGGYIYTSYGNYVGNNIGFGGSSIFIVANTIVFNLAYIATGGKGGLNQFNYGSYIYDYGNGTAGGAGYGGGGGCAKGTGQSTDDHRDAINGNPGDGSGTCFIYCNNVTADYTGVVI